MEPGGAVAGRRKNGAIQNKDFDTTLASVSKASFHVFICPLKRHLHILLQAIYNVLPLCVLSEQSEDVSREKLHQMYQPSLRL